MTIKFQSSRTAAARSLTTTTRRGRHLAVRQTTASQQTTTTTTHDFVLFTTQFSRRKDRRTIDRRPVSPYLVVCPAGRGSDGPAEPGQSVGRSLQHLSIAVQISSFHRFATESPLCARGLRAVEWSGPDHSTLRRRRR